jgi:hypothetical protein
MEYLASTVFHLINLTYHLCCIMSLLAHIWSIYPLGYIYKEPELEEPKEQAQAEDFTNIVWINASPGASHHHS